MCVAWGLLCNLVLVGAYKSNPGEQKDFMPFLKTNLQQTMWSPIKHKAGLRGLITPRWTHRAKECMHAHAQSKKKKKKRVHTFQSCEHFNYFLMVLHFSWQLMFSYQEKSLWHYRLSLPCRANLIWNRLFKAHVSSECVGKSCDQPQLICSNLLCGSKGKIVIKVIHFGRWRRPVTVKIYI